MTKIMELIQDACECSKSICEGYKYLTKIETDSDYIDGEREFALNELLMLLRIESDVKSVAVENASNFYSTFNFASLKNNNRLINILLSSPFEYLPLVNKINKNSGDKTAESIMQCAVSTSVQNLANKYLLDVIHDRLNCELDEESRNKLIELRNSILSQSPLLEASEYGISLDEKSKMLLEDPTIALSMLNVSDAKMLDLEDEYFSRMTNKYNKDSICRSIISDAYLRVKGLKKPKSEENKKAFVFDPNKKSE